MTPTLGALAPWAVGSAVKIDWSSFHAAESDIDRVSGAWVFRGMRVLIAALFEDLEDGVSVPQFVTLFAGVTID